MTYYLIKHEPRGFIIIRTPDYRACDWQSTKEKAIQQLHIYDFNKNISHFNANEFENKSIEIIGKDYIILANYTKDKNPELFI